MITALQSHVMVDNGLTRGVTIAKNAVRANLFKIASRVGETHGEDQSEERRSRWPSATLLTAAEQDDLDLAASMFAI